MSTQTFKAALNAAQFPFLYEQASRSVLIPQQDIAPRTNQGFYGSEANADYNVMQLLFAENVLPIAKGLMSVAFTDAIAPAEPPTVNFDQLILLRDANNNNALFSPAGGANYVFSQLAPNWVSYAPFAFTGDLVTHAYVNGRTLICYQADRVLEWDPAVPTMQTRVLTLPAGYTIADIRGIVGASNYLIAFTDTEILWSSLVNILDFNTPNDGSGRQTPIDLLGKITGCRPISGGFLIYSTENVVAATFTNDAARPFVFRAVKNGSGVSSPEQITGDATSLGHYAYGAAGLQLATLQQAQSIFPECSDFLTIGSYESWNSTTRSIDRTDLNAPVQPKLNYLGSRYLIISYGTNAAYYDFALIYDEALRRWGKFRVRHVDVAPVPVDILSESYRYYTLDLPYDDYEETYEDLDTPIGAIAALRKNFGFLDIDGTVRLLAATPLAGSTNAVAVFGKIQTLRSRKVSIQGIEFDGLGDSPTPRVSLLGSSTGAARDSVTTATPLLSNADYKSFGARVTAQNFDLAVEGTFALTNAIVKTVIHGSR